MRLGFVSGMMLHKVKMEDNKKLKVICILCKSKELCGWLPLRDVGPVDSATTQIGVGRPEPPSPALIGN
jgi:hypothetical protein